MEIDNAILKSEGIKFGPSGNSEDFYAAGLKNSEQSAEWVKNLGLNAFEYSFGRGILMGESKAESLKNAFDEAGVQISVHAPYYTNLANPDDEMIEKTFGYILQSAKMVGLMGGKRVIFHPATQGKDERSVAVARAKDNFKRLADRIYAAGGENYIYCPETMGKLGQLGTVEEIADFCSVDEIFIPTVDFGHVNARECGSLKTKKDYARRLEYLLEKLGRKRMQNFHVHFSKIQYSNKGEIRHLNFDDQKYGPEFEPLAEALVDLDLHPVIICESAGWQDRDALAMKNIYLRVLNEKKG